jgi:hypothetical protein
MRTQETHSGGGDVCVAKLPDKDASLTGSLGRGSSGLRPSLACMMAAMHGCLSAVGSNRDGRNKEKEEREREERKDAQREDDVFYTDICVF